MNQSVLSGKNGMIAQQQRLDTIANNLANINTYGYKAVRTDFKDLLYKTMIRPVQPQDDVNQRRGHGVMAATSTHLFTQGNIDVTNNNLDLCIEGDGYFAVQDSQGNILYTRSGSMMVSSEADGNYLVTAQGMYYLDENGQRIRFEGDASGLGISLDGSVSMNNGAPFAKMAVVGFANYEGLEAAGDNAFRETVASGAPMATPQGTVVHQGALESSNVNMAQEMTMMIRAQRAFQSASRAVTTADQMDGIATAMHN